MLPLRVVDATIELIQWVVRICLHHVGMITRQAYALAFEQMGEVRTFPRSWVRRHRCYGCNRVVIRIEE